MPNAFFSFSKQTQNDEDLWNFYYNNGFIQFMRFVRNTTKETKERNEKKQHTQKKNDNKFSFNSMPKS